MNNSISYEQPLTETIRACLRLEYLFQQIDHQIHDTSLPSTRYTINLINQLLQLADRSDLKIKLSKEIQNCLTSLTSSTQCHEEYVPHQQALHQQLQALLRHLIDVNGKFAQGLRQAELFNLLRLHASNPGGDSNFSIPIYHYWLEQPGALRQTTIRQWLTEFQPIKTAVSLILHCVRNHVEIVEKTAISGFHQEIVHPQGKNLRLLRISLNRNISAYPEMSIGKHFISIRFLIPDIYQKPRQCGQDLPFILKYYYLND